MEVVFEVHDAAEGGFHASAVGHSIFTEGESWQELRSNILEATSLHFENVLPRPCSIQMHYVKDEVLPLEAA